MACNNCPDVCIIITMNFMQWQFLSRDDGYPADVIIDGWIPDSGKYTDESTLLCPNTVVFFPK